MSTIFDNLRLRITTDNDSNNPQTYNDETSSLKNLQSRLNIRGGTDQWTRMREDKLRSLKKALLYSYQSAIVQKYDVKKETLADNILTIISLLQ